MKRKALALSIILALSFSVVAVTLFVNLGEANPSAWTYKGEIPPPANANPPTVSIFSPERKSYATNAVNLTFHVSSSGLPIYRVFYKTDWQESNVFLYDLSQPPAPEDRYNIRPVVWQFPYSVCLTGVPQGRHNITVYATEQGRSMDEQDPSAYYHYYVNGSATISFAIGKNFDFSPPMVTVLSLENKTYNTASVPLNFTVNERVSQISYVFDGQENVTIAGNITLTDLSNGEHNVRVYATDEAENTGVSETFIFTIAVPEPFPTASVVAVSGASALVIGLGIIIYFKRGIFKQIQA